MGNMVRIRGNKLQFSIVLICLFLFIFITACGKGPGRPQKLLPRNIFFVSSINMKYVIKDKDLSNFILSSPPNKTEEYSVSQLFPGDEGRISPSEGRERGEITGELTSVGINPDQVSNLTIFAGLISLSGNSEYEGMIVRGAFNAERKVKQLIQKGWKSNQYLKQSYYCNPYSGKCMVVLGRNTILLGPELTVHEVLKVKKRKEKALIEHPVYRKLSSELEGTEGPINFYLILPQEVLDMGEAAVDIGSTVGGLAANLAGFGMGSLINLAGGIAKDLLFRGIAMSVDHSGGDFPVNVSIFMPSETAAKLASGTINLAKRLSSILPKGQMESREAPFQSMDVSRDGQVLKISMVMTREEFLSW